MIIKHIENPKKQSRKASRIGSLVDYIKGVSAGIPDKAELVFADGEFYSQSWPVQRAETIALALEATRSDDPVDHWLLSWKEGESPSQSHCIDAVRILKRHLGMTEAHLAMCALHRDTDNYHLHVVLNRVDPQTFRVADKGWCIDKAHRAVAEIVYRQGWEPEVNARFIYGEDGQIIRLSRDRRRAPRAKVIDRENATGEKSCERIAMEQAAPALAVASSWQDVHERLARIGMRYELKGSGAVIWVGDEPIKASTIGRAFSKTRMEDRLGRFVSSPLPTVTFRSQRTEPLCAMPPKWNQYRLTEGERRIQKQAAFAEQRQAHRKERNALFETFRMERESLYAKGNWSGTALNVARSLLAAEHARKKADLLAKQQGERNRLHRQLGKRRTYEQYLIEHGEMQLAEEWRYRSTQSPLGVLHGEGEEAVEERDIRDFIGAVRQVANGKSLSVEYRYKTDNGRASFVDHGKRIDVVRTSDERAVLAALQLAAQKWGTVRVDGPGEFKLMCFELAEKHGIRLGNGEAREPSRNTSSNASSRDVYEVHRADILRRISVQNPSRLDWMIAIRMRVTGHSQEEIAKALIAHAGQGRAAGERDWSAYAERTARAAFGPRGDRECVRSQGLAVAWRYVESVLPRRDLKVVPKRKNRVLQRVSKGIGLAD